MTNHIEDVAKLLDLKLDEEFKIAEEPSYTYRITKQGLECHYDDVGWDSVCSYCAYLESLIIGKRTVVKLPFRPKDDEPYWVVNWNKFDPCLRAEWFSYSASSEDIAYIKVGNCFATKEEAEANKFRIYKELTGKEWGEE